MARNLSSSLQLRAQELKDWIASRKCPVDRCSLESEYIMSADYPFPGYQQQQNKLPKAKKDFPRLAAVPSQVSANNHQEIARCYGTFSENRGYGFPRYKKYGQMKSVLFPSVFQGQPNYRVANQVTQNLGNCPNQPASTNP